MTLRNELKIALILAATMLIGCQAPGSLTSGNAGSGSGAGVVASGHRKVDAPPGLDSKMIEPREGNELSVAKLSLDQVVLATVKPSFAVQMEASTTQAYATTNPAGAEPPLEAQHAYLAARDAYRHHQGFDAIRKLQEADRLFPGSAEINRMMGEVNFGAGNKVRALANFEQVARIDPLDAEAFFNIGRISLELGNPNDAIYALHHALAIKSKAKAVDPAVWPMCHYFLGGALEQTGNDLAAIDEFNLAMAGAQTVHRSSKFGREIFVIQGQQNNLNASIGDAYNRMDQPEQALAAYGRINVESGMFDPYQLLSRELYSKLRTNQVSGLDERVFNYIQLNKIDAQTLSLFNYLVKYGVNREALANRLRATYEANGRPSQLAIGLAGLEGPAGEAKVYRDHLKAKPGDMVIFEKLIQINALRKDRRNTDIADDIRTTGAAVNAMADRARDFVSMLTEAYGSASAVIPGIDSLLSSDNADPSINYVAGCVYLTGGRLKVGLERLQASLDARPDFLPARVELAQAYAGLENYPKVRELLAPVEASTDNRIVAVRVSLMAKTGQAADAVKLLDRLIADKPSDMALVIKKAELQTGMGDFNGAERTLLDALDTHPAAEDVYEALFDLYESPRAQVDVQQWQRLMRRLFGAIPQSRIARLQRARLISNQQPREAEALLRDLVRENRRDYKALASLLDILRRDNRKADADIVLTASLAQAPNDLKILAVAVAHYGRVQDRVKRLDATEKFLLLQPEGADREAKLALVYSDQGRMNDAIKTLGDAVGKFPDQKDMLEVQLGRTYLRAGKAEEATKALQEALLSKSEDLQREACVLLVRAMARIDKKDQAEKRVYAVAAKFPASEADLLLEYASLIDRNGDHEGSERVMLDILKRHPDHAGTNNNLGYNWAYQGRNLKEAQRMIELAHQAEPTSGAYLDSLGWVNYKQGNFQIAVQKLRQAQLAQGGQNPVILEHLGDALYRSKDSAAAVQTWTQAKAQLEMQNQFLQSLKGNPNGAPATPENTDEEAPQPEVVNQALPEDLLIETDPETEGMGDRLKNKIDAVNSGKVPSTASVVGEVPGPAPK